MAAKMRPTVYKSVLNNLFSEIPIKRSTESFKRNGYPLAARPA